jgi:hypothetical protein
MYVRMYVYTYVRMYVYSSCWCCCIICRGGEMRSDMCVCNMFYIYVIELVPRSCFKE